MRAAPAGRLFAGMVACFVAGGIAAATEPGFAPIALHATPIAAFHVGQPGDRFGELEFRGGLMLSSSDPAFGSWSGLDFGSDGRLYAVADDGFWLTARIVEDGGRLVGIEDPMIAPILGEDGEPLADKRRADAEGLRIVAHDGRDTALVSFEQRPRVRLYALTPDFALARPEDVSLPAFVDGLPANQGLEAIAVAPPGSRLAGATVVIAEHALDKNGNHRGFVLDGPDKGTFAIRRVGDFDITDAVFLPSGDLLTLERKFKLSEGIFMRIRRIAATTLAPGATLDGTVAVFADMGYQIDNMEGLAVRVGTDGEILVNVISDDNHSPLQRTILLQFVLKPSPPPLPRLRPQAASAG